MTAINRSGDMTSDIGETRIVLARLGERQAHAFDLRPDRAKTDAIRDQLGLLGLRKLRIAGKLSPLGARDWQLKATIGATVVQPCGVTLEPVTTRLDEDILRNYLAEFDHPTETEVAMDEDTDSEPLPAIIDLEDLLGEALSLALPAFPRAEGAELVVETSAPAGADPIKDADIKPFAALSALRDKLTDESQ